MLALEICPAWRDRRPYGVPGAPVLVHLKRSRHPIDEVVDGERHGVTPTATAPGSHVAEYSPGWHGSSHLSSPSSPSAGRGGSRGGAPGVVNQRFATDCGPRYPRFRHRLLQRAARPLAGHLRPTRPHRLGLRTQRSHVGLRDPLYLAAQRIGKRTATFPAARRQIVGSSSRSAKMRSYSRRGSGDAPFRRNRNP